MAEASENTVVLVTGASGYIATHVVSQLLRNGYKVRGTVRSLDNAKKVKPLYALSTGAPHPLELVEADLTKPESWPPAVRGCKYVMHIASPFPAENPKHEDEVIKPAVEGTLSVLRACADEGCVKRVILTSSVAAITGMGSASTKTEPYTEADWQDTEKEKMPYSRSKALAEKAAWDFVAELPEKKKFELVTILPSYVVGPVLCGAMTTSMEVPRRLLHREIPMVLKVNFPCIDVRDVAAAHVNAMLVPEAAGHRHICASQNMWFHEIAQILEREFKPQGYKVPTTNAPYPMLWLVGRFDKTVRMILPSINTVTKVDNTRMRKVLGINPIDMEKTLLDMTYSMIEQGFIKKTSRYTGPPA